MNTLIKCINSITEWTGKVIAWLIIPLFIGMVYEVILRYGFDRPTIWVFDFTWILYGVYIWLGASFTLRLKGHVKMDWLYLRLSTRGQAIADVVCYLIFFFPLMFVLVKYGIDFITVSYSLDERSAAAMLRPPIYPIKAIMVLAYLLLLLQGISELLQSIAKLKRKGQ